MAFGIFHSPQFLKGKKEQHNNGMINIFNLSTPLRQYCFHLLWQVPNQRVCRTVLYNSDA